MKDPRHPDPLDPDIRSALDARLGASSEADEADEADEALLSRVKARVFGAICGEQPGPYRTVRSGEGWEKVAPGVERKVLWRSGGAKSCMLRFAPGAQVAPHLHAHDEECVVLEGTVRIGNIVLQPGDFHGGRQGSMHELSTTDTGAVVFLRDADEDCPETQR